MAFHRGAKLILILHMVEHAKSNRIRLAFNNEGIIRFVMMDISIRLFENQDTMYKEEQRVYAISQ